MEISNLLSISTIEYADYISELPEDQRLIKISEYIEWYLTRTESSFFFNEIEFQIDFTYKNIILSPNGKRYVTLGYDFAIHIHTYPERSLLLKINQNHDVGMLFSYDGLLLGLLTPKEGIILYDIDNNSQVSKYPGNFSTFCFSKKSYMVAGASRDIFQVKVWSGEAEIFFEARSDEKEIKRLQFSNDDSKLCAASLDGLIILWDIPKQMRYRTLDSLSLQIFSINFSPNDEYVALGTDDRAVTLWYYEDNRIQKLRGHKKNVTKILFSNDSKKMVTFDQKDFMIIWSLTEKRPIKPLILVNSVSVSSAIILENEGKNSEILTIGLDISFKSWDLYGERVEEGEEIFFGDIDDDVCNGNEQTYSKDGLYMAKVKGEPNAPFLTVNLWDCKTGNPVKQIDYLPNDLGYIKCLTFSHDNKYFAVCYQYVFYIFKVDDVEIPFLGPIKIDQEKESSKDKDKDKDNTQSISFTRLKFSPLNNLGSGTDLGLICIWKYDEKRELKKTFLKGHEGKISALEFDNENRLLASGDDGGKIRLWSLKDEKTLGEMEKHKKPISILIFNQDSKKLISGSEDYRIIIWNLEDYTQLIGFTSANPNLIPYSMNLNQEETKLVVGYHNGQMEIFKLERKFVTSLYLIKYHRLPILNVKFLEKDSVIMSQSAGSYKSLRFRTMGSPYEIPLRKPINVTSDGKKIISIEEETISITKTKNDTDHDKQELKAHQSPIVFCEITSDNQKMLSCSEDGMMNYWDINKYELLIENIKIPENAKVAKFFSSNNSNEKAVLGGVNGTIFVLEFLNNQFTSQANIVEQRQGHDKEIVCIDVDSDNNFATSSKDCKVMIWSLTPKFEKKIEISDGIKFELKFLKFSFGGNYLYGTMKNIDDEELRKWDVRTGELLTNKGDEEKMKRSRNLCLSPFGRKILSFLPGGKDEWELKLLDENLSLQSAITVNLTKYDRRDPPINLIMTKSGDLCCLYQNKIVIYFDLNQDEEIFIKELVKISDFVNNINLNLQEYDKNNAPLTGNDLENRKPVTMNDLGRVYPFLYNFLHVMAYTDDYKSRFYDVSESSEKQQKKLENTDESKSRFLEIVEYLKKNGKTLEINSFFEEDIHQKTPLEILFSKKNRKLLQEYIEYFIDSYKSVDAYGAGFFKYMTIEKINELMSIFIGENEFINKFLNYLFGIPIDFPQRFYYKELNAPFFITAKEPIMTKQRLEKILNEKKDASTTAQAQLSVKAKCLYVPALIDKTNKQTSEFLLRICDLPTSDNLFRNDTLIKILQYKWQTYGQKVFLKEGLMFVLFIVVYLVNCSYILPYRIMETDEGVSFANGIFQQISCLLNFVVYVFLFFYIKEEVTQINVFGFSSYLNNIWNCFDLPLIIILLAVIFLSFLNMFQIISDQPLTKCIHSFAILFFFLRLLSFARGFQGTGFMVRLVIQCIIDIRYFFVLMFLFIIALTFSSKV